jgi:hypothetical protein
MQMTTRIFAGLVLATLVALGPASAETVTLKSDHPDRYVVQRGDTLWDISGQFLEEPWLWPEVWEVNPQIENPHLIYPGDEIRLTYRDGRPILSLRRGGLVKLGPRVRSEPLDGAIPTIPVDAIQQFLSRPRVMTESEFDSAPYIVSVGREALMGRPGEQIFARRVPDQQKRYAVYRRGQEYTNPQDDIVPTKHGVRIVRNRDKGEVLGIEAVHVGDAVLQAGGDPATLLLTSAKRELLQGDRLVPVTEDEPHQNFYPHPTPEGLSGQIIAVLDGVSQIGELQVVVLNLGRSDGVEVGHVMGVYQRGPLIVDPYATAPPERVYPDHIELDPDKQGGPDGLGVAANDGMQDFSDRLSSFFSALNPHPPSWQTVRLPDRRAGTVLVFRPFERVSYALVMEATGPMHIADYVRQP